MSRRRKGRDIHGVLLLDKPVGYSSNQAVQKVRWLFQARKAGHTGSLDPFATGMLPICLGEASKTAGFMLDASKTYIAQARLGQSTTTGDIEGDVCLEKPVPELSLESIEAAFERFRGAYRAGTTHVFRAKAPGPASVQTGSCGPGSRAKSPRGNHSCPRVS